jgi:hypothetical protein
MVFLCGALAAADAALVTRRVIGKRDVLPIKNERK